MKHMLNRFIATVAVLVGPLASAQTPDVQHGVVFSHPQEFAAWPANEGLWQWDNEILVGFVRTLYQERDSHNWAPGAPRWVDFARSLDGGETWIPEEHPEVSTPARLTNDGRYVLDPDAAPVAEPRAFSGGVDFTAPGFALKARDGVFFISEDRGRHWDGPFSLPNPAGAELLTARTNYLIVDHNTLRLFHSVSMIPTEQGTHGRTLMLETNDGGKSFEFVSWLTNDLRPKKPVDQQADRQPDDVSGKVAVYSVMPGVVEMDDGTILVAIRNRVDRHWVDLLASTDDGRTWEVRSRAFENNNPASLVNLGGDNLAIITGWRKKPYGIRAKLSKDAGRTWSDDIVLRDDAREWDLGYVRAALRPDGKILIVYYYTTTDHPANFIATTLWDPANLLR